MRYSLRITSSQKKMIPLLLRSLGTDHVQNPIQRAKGFPLWQILYGVSGSGEFFMEGARAILRPGQIAILSPNTRHEYHSLGGEWIVHYLGFSGDACVRLLTCLGLSEPGVYTLSQHEGFLKHLLTLQKMMGRTDNAPLSCSKELYNLLLDLSVIVRRRPLSHGAEGSGLIKEVILYLEDHFSEDISLGTLAAQFHLTPEYLCACFKRETQETIMHYLRRIRVHRAKLVLMEAPDLSLREAAKICGFNSASYFGRVFREDTGYTPLEYRLGISDHN